MHSLDNVTDIIGVIHVGGLIGSEIKRYEAMKVKSVVWIEPIEKCFNALKERVEKSTTVKSQVFKEVISDVDGEELKFFEYHKSGISSIYKINNSSDHFRDRNLKMKSETVVKAITLETLIHQNNIDLNEFNCVAVDTQGSELKVLKGLNDTIKKFKYVLTEITEDDYNMYHNGCKYSEVNSYLNSHGFYHDEPEEDIFTSKRKGHGTPGLRCLNHRDLVYQNLK